MGLLDGTTQQQYYTGNDHGNYQFISLDEIINQFEVAYVGENKIIPKIKRSDISFHAHRALQELTFDTLKSCKSQEITVPDSLKMILPQDYVNYVRLSWVDSAGIKHPLYYTHDTNNPFSIAQYDDGTYQFDYSNNLVLNGDFSYLIDSPWIQQMVGGYTTAIQDVTNIGGYDAGPPIYVPPQGNTNMDPFMSGLFPDGNLIFKHYAINWLGDPTIDGTQSSPVVLFQEIDVSGHNFIDLHADGEAVDTAGGAPGILRVGLLSDMSLMLSNMGMLYHSTNAMWTDDWINTVPWFDLQDSSGNPSYLEWTTADNTTSKSLFGVDVTGVNTIAIAVQSVHNFTTPEYILGPQETNNIDNIIVLGVGAPINLQSTGVNSTTWDNYSSATPSEIINDDYEDDTYWPLVGNRYGLDPQYAQTNGSFYVDCRLGKINFSANLAGKTIILDYISDSLGTDEEMQVHKFAEDAMYKSIVHAILETSTYGQDLVPILTKEKFAAVRQAKLRLSNLRLGELTQVLRGKSKQIKH